MVRWVMLCRREGMLGKKARERAIVLAPAIGSGVAWCREGNVVESERRKSRWVVVMRRF